MVVLVNQNKHNPHTFKFAEIQCFYFFEILVVVEEHVYIRTGAMI